MHIMLCLFQLFVHLWTGGKQLKRRCILYGLVAFGLLGCQPIQPASEMTSASPAMEQSLSWDKLTMDMKIANAMSAGPMAIAKDATVIDWPTTGSDGEWIVLREGTNGWTCVTDDWGIGHNTPVNDPMCIDETWFQFLQAAWNGETDPQITQPGIAYMFLGGAVADNDVPRPAPLEGMTWQIDPPHVMLLFPGGDDLSAFPHDMQMASPYVMFGETNYTHVMAPIVIESLEPVDPSDRIANAMSAAPQEISGEATIIEWPTDDTTNFPVLREGTNGWTCLPDDNILSNPTLTNDPMCLDEMWLEWLHAIFEGREPNITRPGISYMLQGGSVADNDDPSISVPAEGGEWQIDPPHLMVLYPGGLDEDTWSHGHASGGPFIMFGGTPYEHLMIPVDPVVTGAMGHMEAAMTISAAPELTLSAPFEMIQMVMDFAPGSWTPRHSHGGPILVTLLEGEVTVRDASGAETIYRAGDSWLEEPGLTISAGNEGEEHARLVATALLPEGAKLTTVADGVESAAQPPGPTDVYETRMSINENMGNFEMIQMVMDFAPGSWTSRHSHGGPILVTLLEGEVTVRDASGAETIYRAGDSWLEEPVLLIAAGNEGEENARIVATALLSAGAKLTTIEDAVDAADQPPSPTDVYEARVSIGQATDE